MEPKRPHETIWGLTTAAVASRTLQVVAELGVADQIEDTPVPAKTLATACDADPDALDRALMLLAAHGIFARDGEAYTHTEASRLLRTDHPMSMRAFPRMMGMPSFTASLGRLDHSLRTGAAAFGLVAPEGLFAHLQDHPDEAAIFDASMSAKAAADIGAVLGAYDFSRFGTIADIGGGRGHLLRAILDVAPDARGTLFDLPAVTSTLDVDSPRLALHPGDFFADPLPPADAYVLMEVIHDWEDSKAADILAAVRHAAKTGATVLIIEAMTSEGRLDPVAHTLDVIMLAITGGRERTPAQLGRLLSSVGFRPTAEFATEGPLRIVEAVAV